MKFSTKGQIKRINKTALGKFLTFGVFFIFIAATAEAKDISPFYTKNLYYGLKDLQVRELQQDLAKDSEIYPEKLVTGYFGNLTFGAVKRFQSKYGIRQTGYVGPLTRAKLNSLYGYRCRVRCTGAMPSDVVVKNCYEIQSEEQCLAYESMEFPNRCVWVSLDFQCPLLP